MHSPTSCPGKLTTAFTVEVSVRRRIPLSILRVPVGVCNSGLNDVGRSNAVDDYNVIRVGLLLSAVIDTNATLFPKARMRQFSEWAMTYGYEIWELGSSPERWSYSTCTICLLPIANQNTEKVLHQMGSHWLGPPGHGYR
jgi:hypothetical protein